MLLSSGFLHLRWHIKCQSCCVRRLQEAVTTVPFGASCGICTAQEPSTHTAHREIRESARRSVSQPVQRRLLGSNARACGRVATFRSSLLLSDYAGAGTSWPAGLAAFSTSGVSASGRGGDDSGDGTTQGQAGDAEQHSGRGREGASTVFGGGVEDTLGMKDDMADQVDDDGLGDGVTYEHDSGSVGGPGEYAMAGHGTDNSGSGDGYDVFGDPYDESSEDSDSSDDNAEHSMAGSRFNDDDDAADSDAEDDVYVPEYREVDAKHDDDADHRDALMRESVFVLPADARAEGRAGLKAMDTAKSASAALAGGKPTLEAASVDAANAGKDVDAADETGADDDATLEGTPVVQSARDQYLAAIDNFAERLAEASKLVEPHKARGLTRREVRAREREGKFPDTELDLPGIERKDAPEPGEAQLKALLGGPEQWCASLVDIKMTTKMTPQGKRHRFSAMVIVGNTAGKGGYGVGAAKDANAAMAKGLRYAILNSINIPLYRQHTVYYPSKTKFIKTHMEIFPRPQDFGINAAPLVMEMCELLGIQDLTVKVRTSHNKRNVVKCFFQALANIPTAAEMAAAKGVYLQEVPTTRMPKHDFVAGQ